jgi:hypothetical protein
MVGRVRMQEKIPDKGCAQVARHVVLGASHSMTRLRLSITTSIF